MALVGGRYLIQNLDLTELRAVMACLPDSFENDPSGEKAAWRTNTLESIRGYGHAQPALNNSSPAQAPSQPPSQPPAGWFNHLGL